MRRTGIALLAAVGLAVVAFAPAAVAAPKTYTAAQVAKHSSASSCWTIVGKNVYDVTKYVAKHPGGASVIKSMCGKDGSAMFRGQHAGESSPTRTLARYRIGTLATSSASSSASGSAGSGSSGSSGSGSSSSGSSGTVITAATVAQHASPSDCWTIISGRVYNLTSFIASHPGGASRIIALCGINGTSAFSTQHAGNQAALAALAPLIIGTDGTVSVSSAPAHATQADDDDEDDDNDSDSDSDSDRDSD